MGNIGYFTVGFAAILGMAAPTAAQTLGDILAPVPDAHACWKRVYSDAHLARHPRQKVVDIDFYLGYRTIDEQNGAEGYYTFSLNLVTREQKGGVTGLCADSGSEGIICGGDCDSGAMSLRWSGAHGSLVLTALSGGFSLTNCDGETPYWLSAEPDDKAFLVHPAPCPE